MCITALGFSVRFRRCDTCATMVFCGLVRSCVCVIIVCAHCQLSEDRCGRVRRARRFSFKGAILTKGSWVVDGWVSGETRSTFCESILALTQARTFVSGSANGHLASLLAGDTKRFPNLYATNENAFWGYRSHAFLVGGMFSVSCIRGCL